MLEQMTMFYSKSQNAKNQMGWCRRAHNYNNFYKLDNRRIISLYLWRRGNIPCFLMFCVLTLTRTVRVIKADIVSDISD